VEHVLNARVPLLKFHLKDLARFAGLGFTKICFDFSINSILPCANTKLLKAYESIDPRVGELGRAIKTWAKSKGIASNYDGYLSSYAWVLMVIAFLQHVRPRVVPSLQEISKAKGITKIVKLKRELLIDRALTQTVCEVDLAFETDKAEIEAYLAVLNEGKKNTDTVPELITQFFTLYSNPKFLSKHVISVKQDGFRAWTFEDKILDFNIEDPFDPEHNPGQHCRDRANVDKVRSAMRDTMGCDA
jgi:DNA polymerase sigma